MTCSRKWVWIISKANDLVHHSCAFAFQKIIFLELYRLLMLIMGILLSMILHAFKDVLYPKRVVLKYSNHHIAFTSLCGYVLADLAVNWS